MRPAFLVLLIPLLTTAAPEFEQIQGELFARGGTLANAWADFDGDLDVDLFVGFNGEPNRLYRNNEGVFQDVATNAALADARATRAAGWGDFDADGDPDLILGFTPAADSASVLKLARNEQDPGRFTDVTASAGLNVRTGAVRQVAWVDFDVDGDLDLYVAFRDRANALFTNDRGRFTDVASSIGLADTRRTVGAVWFDYEQDGDLDVLVGNMDGDANALMKNDRGRFTDVAESVGIAWGGRTPREAMNGTVRPCVGDVNNDGVHDLFFANYGKNGLFLGRDGGRFEDVSAAWGVANDARHDTCAFADFDNDGRLDLYVNGTITGGVAYPDFLLRNTGTAFEEVTPPNVKALAASHGAQWADFDRDGDLDLALAGSAPDASHPVLRNLLPAADARRSLQVRVEDAGGRALRAGAEVRIYAPGTRTLLGMRVVDAGTGYDSQSVQPVHFGLPQLTGVDVEISIPTRNGRVTGRAAGVQPESWVGRGMGLRVADDGSVVRVAGPER
jgi:hypothetical protein